MKKQKIIPTPPIEKENIRLSEPKTTAAGPPSLVSAARHIFREMNLRACVKTLNNLNQIDGIDCPGCAWPDPADHRSSLGEYCENGVKAITEEATYKRVLPEFFKEHSVAELSHWSDYKLGKSGRLTHPMILRPGATHYEPIDWEGAFKEIAGQLNALDSPDEAIFYTSGRTSNEAAFLYQLFVRQFGTNNLPDCSNMCHESSGVALSETLGIGKGSVKLEDFYITDLIVVMGQNPGTNHPRMLSALQTAKRNGAKIISINPLKETGLTAFKHPQQVGAWLGKSTALSDLFLQVRINQDVPLLKAILKLLLAAEERDGNVLDKAFIEEHTEGVDQLKADLTQYDLNDLAEQSGVPLTEIEKAAELIIAAEKMIVCWAMGLTQHKNGVQNIRELVNLLLLKGCVGKPGAGTCPVRGHSNVQGDRTVGIWDRPKPAFLDKLAEVFDFEPPRRHGFNTVEAIEAMAKGRGKVFFAMGGNFLSATPDTEYTAKALQNCELTVQVSTKLNRSHLVTGKTALILPCLGRTEIDRQAGGEQFVSVENSMGIVHSSRGRLEPASEHLLSEPAIVARLAFTTLGDKTKTDWLHLIEDYDRIRDLIERSVPGFDHYNRRVRNAGGFYLPNGARDGDFRTLTGKANFTVNPLPEISLNEGEYLMMTIRSHDQFNTTIYGLDDRYRGIRNGRRVILMNPEDIAAAGLKAGDYVDLFSHYDGVERTAPRFLIVAYDIPRTCVATYFPEANPLVPANRYADGSYTPISKSVVITLGPAII
jgi:molybdopterin-dependent oxidoreductase alpha subunit